jgi:hypothetical protein
MARGIAPKITSHPALVQLLPCPRPSGSLESAPRTSLRDDSERGQWEGFWSVADGRYYTCCTRSNGTEQWYRVSDEPKSDILPFRRAPLVPASGPTRDAPRAFMVSTLGKRSMLVGTWRRRRRYSAGSR